MILPVVTIPTKENPGSAGIEISDSLPEAADTLAGPKLRLSDCIVSPVKVAAVPTILKTDLTSDIEKFLSPTTNLVLSRVLLKISLSPLKKSPSTL